MHSNNDVADTKIVVVGTGHVGAATAFALVLKGLCRRLVLIDKDFNTAKAETLDLKQAITAYPCLSRIDIINGSFDDAEDAAIVIITAGHAEKAGETQEHLLISNYAVLESIIPQLAKKAPHAVFVVATHPVEALTYAVYKLSGAPSHCVLGVGTSLDTGRFRSEIAKCYGVNVRSVSAIIAGQHGIYELPEWSTIKIDGLTVEAFCQANGREYDQEDLFSCFQTAKYANFDIMEHKGSPSFSMAAGITSIVKAILDDEAIMTTVSVVGDFFGVPGTALSVPTRIRRSGVEKTPGWSEDWYEEECLKRTATNIRQSIDSLELWKRARVE